MTETYLRELDAALQGVPAAARATILDDVRAHIADALDEGRDADEILTGLGTPAQVAQDARDQLGIVAPPAPADKAARMLRIAAVALAVVTAAFVSFLLPSYAIEEMSVSSDGTGSTLQTASSLFEQYGLAIALLPLLPAVLALLPLLLPAPARRPMAWANAGIMTVFSVIAGFTIGGFFVPLALLMWAAVLVPLWIRRGRSRIAGVAWRIVGALGIIAPMAFAVVGAVTGVFQDPQAPFWIVVTVVIVIGILFALRVRFVDVIVAILGVALMVLAVVDAGILIIAVWWGGGFWLVAGLSAVAARKRAA